MKIFDFATDETPWRSINDGVMGGVSTGAMVLENDAAVFYGRLSLDNNGGFASVRSADVPHDLSRAHGILLRVRGDGRRYSVRLRTTEAFDGPSYAAEMQPPAGEWTDVTVRFDEFRAVHRGRRLHGHPPLDPGRIVTIGLLIADREEGPFRLDVAHIAEAGASGP